MHDIGTIARVRRPQVAGLLTEDGLPSCPFESARLTAEIPFRVEGAWGQTLYVRLLGGKHEQRLAAIPRQDLEVVRGRPEGLLVS